MPEKYKDVDSTASQRKSDHITLALDSQMDAAKVDSRFYYEPILCGHPTEAKYEVNLLGHTFDLPIWVSSMTGGTERAATINKNLARACGEYKLGMGLGSCRSLLTSDERMSDFDVRHLMGDQPLYANLGIAQIEQLYATGNLDRVIELVKKLQANGLIIHINPLQEWMQPEGDIYHTSPLELIQRVLDVCPEVIVKEVGQGMGPKSLLALMKLPLRAIDFGAVGGTNFALLELLRTEHKTSAHEPLVYLGHTAEEMVDFVNAILADGGDLLCKDFIISGGVKNYLDGYYLINKLKTTSVYGQASAFLHPALESYEALQSHVEAQKSGLLLAKNMLTLKD